MVIEKDGFDAGKYTFEAYCGRALENIHSEMDWRGSMAASTSIMREVSIFAIGKKAGAVLEKRYA